MNDKSAHHPVLTAAQLAGRDPVTGSNTLMVTLGALALFLAGAVIAIILML